MRRALLVVAVALSFGALQQVAWGAPRKSGAYKPAVQDTDAQKSADSQDATDAPKTYEQELQAARDKRDKDLDDAAEKETDARKLNKRKQEILAQYTAILAALRDKYLETHPDDANATNPKQGKSKARSGAYKPANDPSDDDTPTKPERPKNRKKVRDPAALLADAQDDLDDENARHQSKLDDLNAQLKEAKSSNKTRDDRKWERAIEKENNTYNSRRIILERRIRDLGGEPRPKPPAPAPKDGPAPTPAANDANKPR